MFPINENSIGLEEITLIGKTKPHKTASAIFEKRNVPKLQSTVIVEFLDFNLLNNLIMNGSKTIKIVKNIIRHFFHIRLLGLVIKKKTVKQINRNEIIICNIFPGFGSFLIIFFPRENRLLKIQ